MIKAVLFDLDGVIVDTPKYHFMAWKKLADSLKIKFSIEDNESLKGVSRMESLDIILDKGGVAVSGTEKNRLAKMKNTMYVDLVRNLSNKDILPGILTVLSETAQLRLKKALASSSKNARLILKMIGLEKSFDAIIDGNQINKTKPEPEIFLKAVFRQDSFKF